MIRLIPSAAVTKSPPRPWRHLTLRAIGVECPENEEICGQGKGDNRMLRSSEASVFSPSVGNTRRRRQSGSRDESASAGSL